MRKLLVDGDILVYQFAFANECVIAWDELVQSQMVSPERAIYEINDFIKWLLSKTGCEEYIICLSDARNFRYTLDKNYKVKRSEENKPVLYSTIKHHLQYAHPFKIVPLLEADDVMGVLSTAQPGKFIIASVDKDMRTVPGLLFNWNIGKIETITAKQANLFWMMQTLVGDSADGYKGCPGIGPKKAKAALANAVGLRAMWETVVGLFERKGLTEYDALIQARLARILRASDYDFKTKEIKLWTPK